MQYKPTNTVPSVDTSNKLLLNLCIKKLETIKQLGRNNLLGEHYSELIIVIDTIKKVLQLNSINGISNVCESDRLRLDWCVITLEDVKQLGVNNPLGDFYPQIISLIGTIKRVLQPNLVE